MYLPSVGNYLRRMGFPIIGGRTYLRQECAMLRKMLIGLATVAAIGIGAVPMVASARGGGGGGHAAAAAAVSTAVAAAVSTAAGLPSAAVGLASTEVWPRAADLAAGLGAIGFVPCPAEKASTET